MIERPILAAVAVGCVAAAVVWGRSARRLQRAWQRMEDGTGSVAAQLAKSAFRKELHTTILYAVVGVALAATAASSDPAWTIPMLLIAIPVIISLRYGPRF